MKDNCLLLLCIICLCFITPLAVSADAAETPTDVELEEKWIVEPAVSLNPAALFFGWTDAGISLKLVRDLPGCIDAVAYSSLQTRLLTAENSMRFGLTTKYSFHADEMLGIQISFGKKKRQSLGLLGGVHMHAFQEQLNNPDAGLINERYISPILITFNWGLMHSSVIPLADGKKIAIRYFLPTSFSRTPLENLLMSSLEAGLQFSL